MKINGLSIEWTEYTDALSGPRFVRQMEMVDNPWKPVWAETGEFSHFERAVPVEFVDGPNCVWLQCEGFGIPLNPGTRHFFRWLTPEKQVDGLGLAIGQTLADRMLG